MRYGINYDLRKPGRNYDELFKAIKALGSKWAHPLQSLWIVETHLNAVEIRDALLAHIDQNDGLLVMGLMAESAWHGLTPDVANWLRAA